MQSKGLAICCLAAVLLAGCANTSRKAHEIADQNLYKEAQYANAGQPGPTVIVLPCQLPSASYEFKARVSPSALRDFAETEMGKGNFQVLDKGNHEAIFQEIAVAANLGNAAVASKFKKFKLTPPQWLVSFDIVEVQPRSTGFKHLDKQMAGLAGALMGGMLLGDLGAKAGAATMASISSVEEQREWSITLRYRILDGVSGEMLHEGQFNDKTVVFREIKGFMGFDQAQAGGVQIFRSVQGLVQTAVKEIDEKHKMPAVAQAGTVKAQHAKMLAKAPAEKAAKPSAKQPAQTVQAGPDCAAVTLAGVACRMPTAWKTGRVPSVREVALAKNPNIAFLEDRQNPQKKNALAESLMMQSAGPLVTISAPGGLLTGAASGVALTGPGVEGRVFVLPGLAGKADPAAVQALLEKHFQQASVIEGLGVETVESASGLKPILVYKYIQIERRKVELDSKPPIGGDDRGREENTKMVSIPNYHNMAVSIVPRGADLVLALIHAPEEAFTPQLEGFKQLVASIG